MRTSLSLRSAHFDASQWFEMKRSQIDWLLFIPTMAEPTGFEPATSDVTGRRSNQLNYDSALELLPLNGEAWWAVLVSNQ